MLTEVVKTFNIDFVALQETRWPGERCVTSGSIVFTYIDNKDNKHKNGVGFMIHKIMMPQIKQFKVVNYRISYIQIKIKHHNDLVIIYTYASTEMADEKINNIFYGSLENTYDSLPNHCIKKIMRELNAQIGP